MKISREALITIRQSEKFLNLGAEICEALKILVGKRIVPLNAVHAFCDGGTKFIKTMNKFNITSFQDSELVYICDGLRVFFGDIIMKHTGIVLHDTGIFQVTKHYITKDLCFYCHFYQNKKDPTYISYEKDKREEALKYLSDEFWKKTNNAATLKKVLSSNGYDRIMSYSSIELGDGYCHDEFDGLKTYVESFIKQNINRSILLYGYPGTGKTTICKLLAKSLNLKTLMLPISQLNSSLDDVLAVIEAIAPDMVIIDEFDKGTYKAAIFNALEELNKRCKLVIATANDIEYIKSEPGLIRPGRFDKTIKINKIDIRVLSDILGPYSDEFLNTVKNWPPAFVQEVRNVIDVLGVEQAKLEIPKLRKRVNENKQKKYKSKTIVDKSEEENESLRISKE